MYLLDTNIVSETRKPRPHVAVMKWLDSVPKEQLNVSAVTIGEIQSGIEKTRRSDPGRATELEIWLNAVIKRETILPLTTEIMRRWGALKYRHQENKFSDIMLTATAMVHDLTIATRNIRDFEGFEVKLVNPFKSN